MKGAFARRARRRAISVLPTPVGPIMRIFLGVISTRRSSLTCMRRQRLRRAMATARLASDWPMMCLSRAWTISRGVMFDISVLVIQLFDGLVVVGVDADVTGDTQPLLHDIPGAQFRIVEQCASGGLGKRTAGTDGNEVVLGFNDVAIAADHQRRGPVGHRQQRFQLA